MAAVSFACLGHADRSGRYLDVGRRSRISGGYRANRLWGGDWQYPGPRHNWARSGARHPVSLYVSCVFPKGEWMLRQKHNMATNCDCPDGWHLAYRASRRAASSFACHARGAMLPPTAKPHLNSAMRVSQLTVTDLDEDQFVDVRSARPMQALVKSVVQTVCIVLGYPVWVGWGPACRSSENHDRGSSGDGDGDKGFISARRRDHGNLWRFRE